MRPDLDENGLINPAPLDENPPDHSGEPAEDVVEPPDVLVPQDDDLVYDPS